MTCCFILCCICQGMNDDEEEQAKATESEATGRTKVDGLRADLKERQKKAHQ